MNEKEYNFHFTRDKKSNDLYQSIGQDMQDMYGVDVYYMPLKSLDTGASKDSIWGEIQNKVYDKMYGMRMILDDATMMNGAGDIFSKFGLDIQDEVILHTTRKEFRERMTGITIDPFDGSEETIPDDRPKAQEDVEPQISDLIYIPMYRSLFTVSHVEDNENTVAGYRAHWKLICKKETVEAGKHIVVDDTGDSSLDKDADDAEKAEVLRDLGEIHDLKDVGQYDEDATGFVPDRTDTNVGDDAEIDSDDIKTDGSDASDLFGKF
jgi:hypothetical protein